MSLRPELSNEQWELMESQLYIRRVDLLVHLCACDQPVPLEVDPVRAVRYRPGLASEGG